MKIGEYLRAVQVPGAKRKRVTCRWRLESNTGAVLGDIAWYSPWRCYALTPRRGPVVLNAQCLRDVAAFLDSVRTERVTTTAAP